MIQLSTSHCTYTDNKPDKYKGTLHVDYHSKKSIGTVNTSDYTNWTLYRSYFESISANVELQVNSVMCF
jgi:hypothetical protein